MKKKYLLGLLGTAVLIGIRTNITAFAYENYYSGVENPRLTEERQNKEAADKLGYIDPATLVTMPMDLTLYCKNSPILYRW